MVLGARTRYATRFALFRVQIFRGSPLDHENHENITPRKIPAIYGIIGTIRSILLNIIHSIPPCVNQRLKL